MLSFTDLAVDVAEADAYATARGYSDWTGTTQAKEAALRRGQDYIAGAYNGLWSDDFDDDTAPDEVRFAIFEASRRELKAPGSLAPDYVAAQQVRRISKAVGPIRKDVEYAGTGSASDVAPVIAVIDRLLDGWITPRRVPSVLIV